MATTGQQRNRASPPVPSAFGNLLKRLRIAGQLTQEELAERAGVSARLISDLERGVVQRSRRDTVEMLAVALELEETEKATFAALSRRKPAAPAREQAASAPPRNLPAQTTSFVGREREISAVTSLLLQPETRLVTLTGPGGVGKTRLAIEIAERSSEAFPDGVIFVDFSAVARSNLVLPAIGRTLDTPDGSEAGHLEEIVLAVEDGRILLVLDNLEHLVDAGPDIAGLLDRCPGMKVLATSRQILQLRAEREYPVSPLGLPQSDSHQSLEVVEQTPAIRLFVQRAEAAQPSFALTEDNAATIAEIVRRLDGLPLAIELAAARMRLLAPTELLQRLNRSLPLLTGGPRDVPDRQQTLRAAIDWSFELLTPDEQRLFTRLAVFTGGFTLDAAEYLMDQGDSLAPEETIDTLASLVEKSLIQRQASAEEITGQPASRFRMLETIREYGLEKLATAGDREDVRDRHAAWCVDLASQSDAGLNSPEQSEWLARLQLEQENFRAALDWAIEMGRSEMALTLSGSLLRFWVTTGQFADARRLYELALDLDPTTETAARAKVLLGIEVVSYFQGDYEAAKSYGEEGLRIYQALDERNGIGWAYGNLGLIADAEEDYSRATELYSRALEIFRELGDRTHTHFMLGNLGLIAHFQDDQDRAADLLEESLELSRELGNQNSVAINLSNLGLVAFALGDLDRAFDLQIEAVKLRIDTGNEASLARSFDNFAVIAVERAEHERAARLFAMAEGLRLELGTALQPNDAEFNRPYVERARENLGRERFVMLWEEGAAMAAEDAIDYAVNQSHPSLIDHPAGS